MGSEIRYKRTLANRFRPRSAEGCIFAKILDTRTADLLNCVCMFCEWVENFAYESCLDACFHCTLHWGLILAPTPIRQPSTSLEDRSLVPVWRRHNYTLTSNVSFNAVLVSIEIDKVVAKSMICLLLHQACTFCFRPCENQHQRGWWWFEL